VISNSLFCVGVGGGGGKDHVVEAVGGVAQDTGHLLAWAVPMLCDLAKSPSLWNPGPAYTFYKHRAPPTSIYYCYQRQRSCMRRAILADGCVVEETSTVKARRKDNKDCPADPPRL
jgi:hypothetical protein